MLLFVMVSLSDGTIFCCVFLLVLQTFSFLLNILLYLFSFLVYWVELSQEKAVCFPVRLGGLGVFDPLIVVSQQRSCSVEVNACLIGLIISQVHQLGDCLDAQVQLRSKFHSRSHQEQLQFANHLFDELTPSMRSSVMLAQEKGASNWLSCLPLKSHNFVLHKTAFRDAIMLHYHWLPSACPTSCACGHSFTIEHALSCPKGGFPSLRHTEVHDLTANLLSEVCNNVVIEPHLQPLSSETLQYKTANRDDNARLDIAANGFWRGQFERSYFDVRIFNPNTPSNQPLHSAY